MSKNNITNNIQQAKEDFRENSLVLKVKPYTLRRFDTYNYVVSTEKTNKNTNEDYEVVLGYYSSLHSVLVSLFKRIYKKYPRKEAFVKYYFYKAKFGVKDLNAEVKKEFNKEVKLSKTKGYVFYNTYITNTEAIDLGAIKP